MSLWAEIKRRWNLLPDKIPYLRLENHVAHACGGVTLAFLFYSFFYNWITVGVIILIGTVIREVIQIKNERQVLLVAVYDVWQYHFYIPFLMLYYHYYLNFVVLMFIWIIGYVWFLLNDNDWFRN